MTRLKQIKVQYNSDREATKNSALSSKQLDKYKYLTGEDLGNLNIFHEVKFLVKTRKRR